MVMELKDMERKKLNQMLGVEHSIIMAPMFLVSNTKMIIAAIKSGIAACIPALNFRTDKEFRDMIQLVKRECKCGFGVNLIVNKANINLEQQLKSCIDLKVNFIITSLGNPKVVIDKCKNTDIQVFCDVVDVKKAVKVEYLGADAIIAVNSDAGGHSGSMKARQLIPELLNATTIPIISAGGVGDSLGVNSVLGMGASGLSIGSPFIACSESDVSEEYKQACVIYGKSDIVHTTLLSGTPCAVINTPYLRSVGTELNVFWITLSRIKMFKKIVKSILFFIGMKRARKAAFTHTYKTIWSAGPSIEHTNAIEPISVIVKRLTSF